MTVMPPPDAAPTAAATTMLAPPPQQQQQQRTVARPVANLGNTCYVNCVLQALAHAPELCMAMDCEPHSIHCPIFAANAAVRRASRSSSPEDNESNNDNKELMLPPVRKVGTRKSRRRSPQQLQQLGTGGSLPEDDGGSGTAAASATSIGSDKNTLQFCALCEVEEHLHRVHDLSKRDKPVVPTTFVQGFIEHVAPWFKLGVQEDSHEFLRLLIDAMQKSCKRARTTVQDTYNPQGQDGDKSSKPVTRSRSLENNSSNATATATPQDNDTEYPFSLFRGTVQSNVTCEYCKASSCTLDPIEDIGLEVTLPSATLDHHGSSRTLTSSRTNSPVNPTSSSSNNNSNLPQLADVQSAFQRFARAEALDASYKCEKCNKVGRATKQSQLASIPPILTLQLKRFRYGETRAVPVTGRRAGTRSNEVNQLLASAALSNTTTSGGPAASASGSSTAMMNDFAAAWSSGGKSGSAKIEGHIKFDLFFDLQPYLTEQLRKQHKNMFCRLFAVIVHAGKNSHSGHYIAYVRSVSKNEWSKMDDGRVTAVPEREVMQAEAYMLFYRVVQHPVSRRLEELNRERLLLAAREQEHDTAPVDTAAVVDASSSSSSSSSAASSPDNKSSKNHGNDDITPKTAREASVENTASRKRSADNSDNGFQDGFEWARSAKTNLPPNVMTGLVRKAQYLISEEVQLSSDYFKMISEKAANDDDALGRGPSTSICEDDIVGGTDKFRRKLCDLFYRLAKRFDSEGHGLMTTALPPSTTTTTAATISAAADGSHEKRVAVVEPEDADLL